MGGLVVCGWWVVGGGGGVGGVGGGGGGWGGGGRGRWGGGGVGWWLGGWWWGVALGDSYRRVAYHGRLREAHLETTGDYRGQFPRTDFGPVLQI